MSVEFGVGSGDDLSVPERPVVIGAADRRVFAHVYDTYAAHLFDYCKGLLRSPAAAANAVQDTLIAADTQIGKLRDYERLPVWLYCIARLQSMSERAHGGPAAAAAGFGAEYDDSDYSADYDFSEEYFDGPGLDGAEPATLDADADGPDGETLLVVRAALDGLSDRDREVLSLAFRHGVDNAGIAVTLGVSAGRARALVSGASTRFEKSAAVVAMLSRGWANCPVVEDIVGDWDPASPALTPYLLDRLIRHIGSCGNCSERRGYTVFRPELLGAVPLATPPAELRFRITNTAADPAAESYRRDVVRRIGHLDQDGFPVQPARRHSLLVVLAASSAALVVLVVGGALLYKLTFASPVGLSTAAGPSAGPGTAASSSASSRHARKSPAARHVLAPLPGLFGPSSAPAGAPPVPLPHTSKHSPSPKPSHSKSPSPSASPSKHTTTPSPTPTTPTPTPTTPTPTPTSPSPSTSTPPPIAP